jgi:hypothetical protein
MFNGKEAGGEIALRTHNSTKRRLGGARGLAPEQYRFYLYLLDEPGPVPVNEG